MISVDTCAKLAEINLDQNATIYSKLREIKNTFFELGGMMCDLQSAMFLLFLGVMLGIFLSGVILK